MIAAFVRTRVLDPERAEFRRGLVLAYQEKFSDARVPYAYRPRPATGSGCG